MIYEEVLASVQIDGDAAQTLTSTSTNITVPSGTDIDLTFCATNFLTGNTVSVDGSTSLSPMIASLRLFPVGQRLSILDTLNLLETVILEEHFLLDSQCQRQLPQQSQVTVDRMWER